MFPRLSSDDYIRLDMRSEDHAEALINIRSLMKEVGETEFALKLKTLINAAYGFSNPCTPLPDLPILARSSVAINKKGGTYAFLISLRDDRGNMDTRLITGSFYI